MCFSFLRMRTIYTFDVPQRALGAARRRTPAMAWAHVVFLLLLYAAHVVFCTRSVQGIAVLVGYGRGYSSSADPMSVDLAVELGEGQS